MYVKDREDIRTTQHNIYNKQTNKQTNNNDSPA